MTLNEAAAEIRTRMETAVENATNQERSELHVVRWETVLQLRIIELLEVMQVDLVKIAKYAEAVH